MNKILIAVVALVLVGGIAWLATREDQPSHTASSTAPVQAPATSGDSAGTPSSDIGTAGAGAGSDAAASAYADGTYTATGSYTTPGGTEQIGVSVTVENGIVTRTSVTPMAKAPQSQRYQSQFAAGYQAQVVGVSLQSLSVTRVSGSSLTPVGFNAALREIRAEAAV